MVAELDIMFSLKGIYTTLPWRHYFGEGGGEKGNTNFYKILKITCSSIAASVLFCWSINASYLPFDTTSFSSSDTMNLTKNRISTLNSFVSNIVSKSVGCQPAQKQFIRVKMQDLGINMFKELLTSY